MRVFCPFMPGVHIMLNRWKMSSIGDPTDEKFYFIKNYIIRHFERKSFRKRNRKRLHVYVRGENHVCFIWKIYVTSWMIEKSRDIYIEKMHTERKSACMRKKNVWKLKRWKRWRNIHKKKKKNSTDEEERMSCHWSNAYAYPAWKMELEQA